MTGESPVIEPQEPNVAAPETVQRDLIVIGTSAGGVSALQQLIGDLPAELPATCLVVLHVMSEGVSVLDNILDRAGPLPVSSAREGDRLSRGHVFVAPPDHHMLVRGDSIHLSRGPRENGHRPAIDPLFRSAARAHGRRVIGVVLSGALDDGTDGLLFIKERGGATVVQDPDDAAYPDMPRNALNHVGPDHVTTIAEMAATLCALVDAPIEGDEPAGPSTEDPPGDLIEAELGRWTPEGDASLLTCPECGGVLLERDEGRLVRFACQVGHAYSPESLIQEQGVALEAALWKAQRTLEERAELLQTMARRARRQHPSGRSRDHSATRFERRAKDVADQADVVRETILRLRGDDHSGNGGSANGE